MKHSSDVKSENG